MFSPCGLLTRPTAALRRPFTGALLAKARLPTGRAPRPTSRRCSPNQALNALRGSGTLREAAETSGYVKGEVDRARRRSRRRAGGRGHPKISLSLFLLRRSPQPSPARAPHVHRQLERPVAPILVDRISDVRERL